MTTTYLQSAIGNCSVRVIPGTPHCGPDDRRCDMKYDVQIKYGADPLDENGFLLDNMFFKQFFADLEGTRVSYSCERLATILANMLHDACKKRAVQVCVKLSAVPDVWICVIIE